MPKKKSSELFDLIHSLNKSESRYFKLFSDRHTSRSDKDYIVLFDKIAKQKDSNDHSFHIQFKNYSRLKHYLYRSILQSLRSYQSNKNKNTELRKYLNDIELLYEKGLYFHSKKLLKKAKQIANKHEKFNTINELVEWEIKILHATTELKSLEQNIPHLLNESQIALQKEASIVKYMLLYSQIFRLIRSVGIAKNKSSQQMYDKIISNPLLKSENAAKTEHSKMLFYHIHAVYAHAIDSPVLQYEHSAAMIHRMEKSSFLLNDEKERYVIGLNNIVESAIRIKKYKEASLYISKMNALLLHDIRISSLTNLSVRIFARSLILNTRLYNAHKNYNQSLQVILKNESTLKKIKNRINTANLIEVYYQIAYSNFFAGHYKTALKWVNKIITNPSLLFIEHFYSYSLFLNIYIHIELSNYDHAKYLLKRVSAQLPEISYFEHTVLNLSQEIIDSQHSVKEIKKGIYNKYLKIFKSSKQKYMDISLQYFDIISWIESKIIQESL